MLNLNSQTPQQSLSADIIRFRPNESHFTKFKDSLNKLLSEIDEADREKNQENHIRDFLLNAFYKDSNAINGKGDIDLVIHEGKTEKEKVDVIIETKRPKSLEMISIAKSNNKALYQAILYFMQERIDEKNTDLKYIVVTNISEWFIFQASDFNKIFYENADFRKEFEKWNNELKIKNTTDFFYNEIAKPFVASLETQLKCTHFNLKDYISADEESLIALYKVFSPFHLLKKPFENDSNSLDRHFYTELLNIIGLEERKEKNKLLIKRKAEPDRGSLLEKAIAKIESKFSRFDQKKILDFGATRDERIYNIALELCIVWTNRILFLKLLESQLVAYHENAPEFHFLNKDMINNFGELYVLFHDVLNKTIVNRNADVQRNYAHVPYLNSSLFDFADVENLTVTVDELDDNTNLKLPNDSILKKLGEANNELPTLEYLFRFLNAYDFASEGKEGVQKENCSLINASVLGKVFEKINGYKDGSIYTPGFITMYMCRQAIRLAVVQKFRDETDFDSNDFDDLRRWANKFYKADDIKRCNEIINLIKLCDPAVGSGHFLVSALNEILAIKSELGIFADAAHNPFSSYEIKVANDEIVVTDRENKEFRYIVRDGKPLNDEMQNLQKTLFHEKQMLIENCLFGVDINPNSVKICRLRLWIELLKNAYYKPADNYAELETLPNIDINIKQGNSLLSRFALDADLKQALKTKGGIKDYRDKVNQYKNERNRETKRELAEIIDKIKADFRTEIFKSHPKMRELLKFQKRFDELNSRHLFEKYNEVEREIAVRKVQGEIDKVTAEIEAIKTNVIYKNAFEWRFEFPEVLDNDGNLLGFDVVIGNPPYIEARSSVIEEELKDKILLHIKERRKEDSNLITRGADILVYFYEIGLSILKESGYFTFITQNAWLDTDYGYKFQKFLRNNTQILGIYDNDMKYFDESANINTIITLFKGNKPNPENTISFAKFRVGFENAPYFINEISEAHDIGQINNFSQNDEIFNEIKWGIILNSDDLIIDLHRRLFERESEAQPSYKIGQGLNLTKDYFIDRKRALKLDINEKNLIPFFTNDDGAVFSIKQTNKFLIELNGQSNEEKLFYNKYGIKTISLNDSTRRIPSLILPRGVGRFFCAINNCNAYSSSFVEIYLEENQDYIKNLLYLWTFLNSSVGWFIREISGRKNLGGGMLKAEAIDLKNYPIFFDLCSDLPKIKELYEKLSYREAKSSLIELDTPEHIEIDDIIFNKLEYSNEERSLIKVKLSDLILFRVNKSRSKI